MLHFQTRRATSPSTWSTMASPLWSSMFIAEVRRGNQASASHSSFQQQPTPSQIHVFFFSFFTSCVSENEEEILWKESVLGLEIGCYFGHSGHVLWGKIASQFLHLNSGCIFGGDFGGDLCGGRCNLPRCCISRLVSSYIL